MKDFVHITPDEWLAQTFGSSTARTGGIIKRSLDDIDRITGRNRFLDEIRERGFQAVINRDDMIVFCNEAPVRLAAARRPLVLR